MALMDTWGSFTIGVLVAAFLFITYIFYEHNLGPWLSDDLTEDKAGAFWRNLWRSFNPLTNTIEVFWRPAVNGVNGNRLGTGKLVSSINELRQGEGGEEKEGRMRGLDGIRALVFLWVLAYELNLMLGWLDDTYKESRWGQVKDEDVFLWKIAGQGYEGLSLYLVISGLLFSWANLQAQNEAPAALDSSITDSRTFFKKYMPLIWRRMTRILPALYVAVFFVGFVWPSFINTDNTVLGSIFLGKCEKMWWPNMFLVGNFFKEDCYANLWAVSLGFQLGFLAPLPCWLYAQGGRKRRWAYGVVYAMVALSLLARFATVFRLRIALDPVGDGEHLNKFWLQRMPWARAGEYCMGVLCCFSVFDERNAEPQSLLDVFRIVGEDFKTWLGDARLLFTTTVQTATLAAGFFFFYEGTLQWHEMNINYDDAGAGAILVLGDLIVASMFALLVRWGLSALHGSWLKALLGSPLWFPLAQLSYTAFLFQLAACYWAVEILTKDYATPIITGYDFFAKAYFLALLFALGQGLLVTVLVEKPLLKLGQLK